MKNAIATLTLLMGSLLWTGCSDDSSPTGPGTTMQADTLAKPDTSKAPVLVNGLLGEWVADTTLQVGMFQVGMTSTVVFQADGGFVSTMTAAVLGNPIAGDLYRGEGTWAFSGPDTLIATSTNCTAADTAKATGGMLSGMSLPFAQVENAFVANAHKPSSCPEPMILDPHPASTSIRIVQTLDIPTQGKQDIPLTFVRKP
ncbi:MAG TPA: hypothetical protein PKO15_13915 [Fibrobacteria bacterium]|nr:hypothetical protein [Fibrobacteria bacterium]HOX53465.1 hypothetical protein [Fibrobacteria bacterium]